jgi:hypothetical protein
MISETNHIHNLLDSWLIFCLPPYCSRCFQVVMASIEKGHLHWLGTRLSKLTTLASFQCLLVCVRIKLQSKKDFLHILHVMFCVNDLIFTRCHAVQIISPLECVAIILWNYKILTISPPEQSYQCDLSSLLRMPMCQTTCGLSVAEVLCKWKFPECSMLSECLSKLVVINFFMYITLPKSSPFGSIEYFSCILHQI